MINTILSRLPLCIEYSEFAYKVTLGDDQDTPISELVIQFNKHLRSLGVYAKDRAEAV